MTKLLINNTEKDQTQRDTDIVLFGRPANNVEQRIAVRAKGFEPYFYAPRSEAGSQSEFLLSQESIVRLEDTDDIEPLAEDEKLTRIYTRRPQDVPEAKQFFDQTWEADVPFTNRFLIDSDIEAYIEVPDDKIEDGEAVVDWREIKAAEPRSPPSKGGGNTSEATPQNTDPRVVTLDIEVDDRGDGFPSLGEERILSIVAHDSYTGEVVAFLDTDGRDAEEVAGMFGRDKMPDSIDELDIGDVDQLNIEPTERRMLMSFRSWFTNNVDPDIVTGWNADEFDIPFIIERMDNLPGLSADALSPMGWAGITSRGEPRIKGRTVYDMLDVYKANSFTELRSYTLDDVAKAELDEEKIHFDGSFYNLYENNAEKFLRYNTRDVLLVTRIDNEAGVIDFRDTLRREVGVMFEDSYNNKDFIDMMCRRKLKELGYAGPTRPDYGDEPDSDYEGAFVFEPYKGVTNNVIGIDLASLYPYTMAMLNASPETKVSETESAALPTAKAAGGQHFSLEEDGLFKQLVDDAISLKSEYKEKREAASNPEERDKYDKKYKSAKTITNSIYGVTGWERFFLYDEDVAEAVTLTGQMVIKRTAEYVEECGHDVVYGDTDSTYIKFSDDWDRDQCLSAAHEFCDELNNNIYPELAEQRGIPPEKNLWEIEVEVYMERFFQAGKKKRYAYRATWKDGTELEEPDVSISGFSSKRSDSSQLTKETEEKVLKAILDDNIEDVSTYIFDAAEALRSDDVEWERIGIPGGLNNKITDSPEKAKRETYYAVSCDDGHCYPQDAHPRAAYNANLLLGTDIGQGDKPMRVYLRERQYGDMSRRVDVIAFEDRTDIEGTDVTLRVDTSRMIEVSILRPFEKICDAVDVDVGAAARGQEQTGLGMF